MRNNSASSPKYLLSEYCCDPIFLTAFNSDFAKSDKDRVFTSKGSTIIREWNKKKRVEPFYKRKALKIFIILPSFIKLPKDLLISYSYGLICDINELELDPAFMLLENCTSFLANKATSKIDILGEWH